MTEPTPMMRQYREIKQQHPDCILMFRLGDFYEMFFEDALLAARELEITLTSREAGPTGRAPMCGVPYHAVESYLARLIERGYRVAVCDQVEDPRLAKGLVKREVTRVVTPGTVLEPAMLDEKRPNFLAGVAAGVAGYGLALVDLSTGQFMVTELAGSEARARLLGELARLEPPECLLDAAAGEDPELASAVQAQGVRALSNLPLVDAAEAERRLRQQFGVLSLEAFGCQGLPLAQRAAAGVLRYLEETARAGLNHLAALTTYRPEECMVLDSTALRNLEVTQTIRGGGRKGSLLGVLDLTVTAMGGRMLRQWLERPLLDIMAIGRRQDGVQELSESLLLRQDARGLLNGVYDLERLVGRVSCGHANARDLLAVRQSLACVEPLRVLLAAAQAGGLVDLLQRLDPLPELADLLERSIREDAPAGLREGGLIRDGYDAEVDRLRQAAGSGKSWIAELEAQEREATGIKSLKVGFNKVFGYYLEVTRPNLAMVPERYQRRQTLTNGERFITPELKEFEERVLGAEERLVELEYELFLAVREEVALAAKRLQRLAAALAELDVLAALAEAAMRYHYTRPVLAEQGRIFIRSGRHPVVEQLLREEKFVPNDSCLESGSRHLMVLTGPNMAGKSTYMRQVALIALLAQTGSFVPAEEARLFPLDRIFTRVGASDDLATGQSTFMVEMLETAHILLHATPRSLVLLDEIGRGTSTFDGMSIAQAVIEYLQRRGSLTLFSTHYHELTVLAEHLPGVFNCSMGVREDGGEVVFLRQVLPGGSDRSYGLNVARLSGLPGAVLARAAEILAGLEGKAPELSFQPVAAASEPGMGEELLEELLALDLDRISPLEALNWLADRRAQARRWKGQG